MTEKIILFFQVLIKIRDDFKHILNFYQMQFNSGTLMQYQYVGNGMCMVCRV